MGENAAPRNNRSSSRRRHHHHHQVGDISRETLPQIVSKCFDSFDDDGRLKQTGTLWMASPTIITAMVGTQVLCRAGDIAQLGWIADPAVILLFSFVGYTIPLASSPTVTAPVTPTPASITPLTWTLFTQFSVLFSGGARIKACGFIQYLTIFGTAIRCIVVASTNMMAIKYMNCLHESSGENPCYILSNPCMIMFGIIGILLSKIPDFDQIGWLSIVAAFMSFTSSPIGLGLVIAQIAGTANGNFKGSLTGISVGDEIWGSFRALGNIAFSYSFSEILIEIQDTIRSAPSEAKTMKKATFLSTAVMTTTYMLCGCMGHAAFRDTTPGNLLAGFDEPFWLLEIANAATVIYLIGACQLYCQPIFAFIEKWAAQSWRGSEFVAKETKIPIPGFSRCDMKLFRLVRRTVFMIRTTVISMLFPFFSKIADIITLGFWPLMVYFPVEMYIMLGKFS